MVKKTTESNFFALDVLATKPSIDIGEQILEVANTHPGSHDQKTILASLIAERTLQNVLCTLMLDRIEPGAEEGAILLEKMYDAFKATTIARWNKQDLKDARAQGII